MLSGGGATVHVHARNVPYRSAVVSPVFVVFYRLLASVTHALSPRSTTAIITSDIRITRRERIDRQDN